MSQEILGLFTLTLQNYSSLIWNSNYQGYLIFLLLRVLAKSGNAIHEIDSRKYQGFVISSTVQTESINIQLAEQHLGHFFGKWRDGWAGRKVCRWSVAPEPTKEGESGQQQHGRILCRHFSLVLSIQLFSYLFNTYFVAHPGPDGSYGCNGVQGNGSYPQSSWSGQEDTYLTNNYTNIL